MKSQTGDLAGPISRPYDAEINVSEGVKNAEGARFRGLDPSIVRSLDVSATVAAEALARTEALAEHLKPDSGRGQLTADGFARAVAGARLEVDTLRRRLDEYFASLGRSLGGEIAPEIPGDFFGEGAGLELVAEGEHQLDVAPPRKAQVPRYGTATDELMLVFVGGSVEHRLRLRVVNGRIEFDDADRLAISRVIKREHAQRRLLADAVKHLEAYAAELEGVGPAATSYQRAATQLAEVRNLVALAGQVLGDGVIERHLQRALTWQARLYAAGGIEPPTPVRERTETTNRSVGEDISRTMRANEVRAKNALGPTLSDDVVLWLYGGEKPPDAKLRAWAQAIEDLEDDQPRERLDVDEHVARELLNRAGWKWSDELGYTFDGAEVQS